jgi:hypothetical protein
MGRIRVSVVLIENFRESGCASDFASVSFSCGGTNAAHGYEEPDAHSPTKVFRYGQGCKPLAM